MSDLNFNPRFNIAEGLTTDAILGLDFLEDNKCVLNLARDKMFIADQSIPLTLASDKSKHSISLCLPRS